VHCGQLNGRTIKSVSDTRCIPSQEDLHCRLQLPSYLKDAAILPSYVERKNKKDESETVACAYEYKPSYKKRGISLILILKVSDNRKA
jgi:hypothetical protein